MEKEEEASIRDFEDLILRFGAKPNEICELELRAGSFSQVPTFILHCNTLYSSNPRLNTQIILYYHPHTS